MDERIFGIALQRCGISIVSRAFFRDIAWQLGFLAPIDKEQNTGRITGIPSEKENICIFFVFWRSKTYFKCDVGQREPCIRCLDIASSIRFDEVNILDDIYLLSTTALSDIHIDETRSIPSL